MDNRKVNTNCWGEKFKIDKKKPVWKTMTGKFFFLGEKLHLFAYMMLNNKNDVYMEQKYFSTTTITNKQQKA